MSDLQAFLASPKGKKRIDAIAKDYNRNHRICMKQCREMAISDVTEWAEKFLPATFGKNA